MLLKGAKYFTALDLWSGYYHIKLDEESIPKSALTTVFGKFEFLKLPFGVSQGADFFIHSIYDLFRLDKTSTQVQGSGNLAYLYDILIYSKTEKETLTNVRQSIQMITQGQTQNQVVEMLLQRTNSLYRPPSEWNVHPSTCQQTWGAYET